MTPSAPLIQRYRRVESTRAGDWKPLDSSWKSEASAGLVGHDMYHHLPDDTGTFAEELATIGAEWYVDRKPLNGFFGDCPPRELKALEGNVVDTVLNAIDSKEEAPFCLPSHNGERLSEEEMAFFSGLAQTALAVLEKSDAPKILNRPDFALRLVGQLLRGYAAAKARFPDQAAARIGSRELRENLADLGHSEVPVGHEVTLTLDGYDCGISYTDADADFLAAKKVVEAKMMVWCSGAPPYAPVELTFHDDESSYREYAEKRFLELEEQGVSEELQILPRDESHTLFKVYLANERLQKTFRQDLLLQLPFAALDAADRTPRGIPIF